MTFKEFTLRTSTLGATSKTSGVGKKVEVMVFFISTDAWIFQENWLVTGWKIHRQLSEVSGLADRDYLVPKPTPCLNGFRKAMVKYGDALVMTRALLLELRVDIKVGSESARSEELLQEPLLVTSHATAFWSEHSERGTIDTWMQMAGEADGGKMVGQSGGRLSPTCGSGCEGSPEGCEGHVVSRT